MEMAHITMSTEISTKDNGDKTKKKAEVCIPTTQLVRSMTENGATENVMEEDSTISHLEILTMDSNFLKNKQKIKKCYLFLIFELLCY